MRTARSRVLGSSGGCSSARFHTRRRGRRPGVDHTRACRGRLSRHLTGIARFGSHVVNGG
jgi:hypothetical protein